MLIESKINSFFLNEKLKNLFIKPNNECIIISNIISLIIHNNFNSYNVFPVKEGGICFLIKNNNFIFKINIMNDLDIEYYIISLKDNSIIYEELLYEELKNKIILTKNHFN